MQIRSNCWIRGLTVNRFFIQRSRCCDHNEYSVKILHAVRSAIRAIAELLVSSGYLYSNQAINDNIERMTNAGLCGDLLKVFFTASDRQSEV